MKYKYWWDLGTSSSVLIGESNTERYLMYNTIVKRHKKLYMNENPLCGSNIGPIISRVQVGNSKITLQKSQ